MSKSQCQAKNPQTCRYHGTKESNTTETLSAVPDLFAQALSSNPRIAAMEKQIIWTKNKKTELQQQYEKSNPEITEEFSPLSYNDPRLQQYNETYTQLLENATEEELESVKDYTGILYAPINELLRDDKKFEKRFSNEETYLKQKTKAQQTITHLDSYIDKTPSTLTPRNVYRVLEQDMTTVFTDSESYATQNNFTVGSEVHFPNYSSTSIDPSFINSRVGKDDEHTSIVLVISTRKGAPVGLTATHKDEHNYVQDTEREILLPRNTRYKVTQVSRTRFTHRDEIFYPSVEPITVYLEEIE